MNMVLQSFDVVRGGEVISHYELFKNGFHNEVRTTTEIIHTGLNAERHYDECLEMNREIASMIGAEVIER